MVLYTVYHDLPYSFGPSCVFRWWSHSGDSGRTCVSKTSVRCVFEFRNHQYSANANKIVWNFKTAESPYNVGRLCLWRSIKWTRSCQTCQRRFCRGQNCVWCVRTLLFTAVSPNVLYRSVIVYPSSIASSDNNQSINKIADIRTVIKQGGWTKLHNATNLKKNRWRTGISSPTQDSSIKNCG